LISPQFHPLTVDHCIFFCIANRFAFIEYDNPDMAREARDEMDRFVIRGRELEVVFAQERRKTPNEMRGRVVSSPPGSASGGVGGGSAGGGGGGGSAGGGGRRDRSGGNFERYDLIV